MVRDASVFKNILVIHFGQLGDVVLGLPALSAIRKRFADARITLLLGKATGEIARIAKVSDEQILVDRVALRDGNTIKSIIQIGRLVKSVRAKNFDLVIDLNSLYETNLLGFLSGAKHRLYENRARRSLDFLSNLPTKPPREVKTKHHTDRYLAVLEPLDIQNAPRLVAVTPRQDDLDAARMFLGEKGIEDRRLIGLFLGAGHPTRRWEIENFIELARRLSAVPMNQMLVFLGPEERRFRPGLQDRFGDTAIVVDEMSLTELFAGFSLLDVFVGGDTGPMHLAALAGSGVVLLSEKGSVKVYYPLIENLCVIDDRPLPEVTVDQVEAAVIELTAR